MNIHNLLCFHGEIKKTTTVYRNFQLIKTYYECFFCISADLSLKLNLSIKYLRRWSIIQYLLYSSLAYRADPVTLAIFCIVWSWCTPFVKIHFVDHAYRWTVQYTKYHIQHTCTVKHLRDRQVFRLLTLVLLNPDIPCLCKQCRSRCEEANWSGSALFAIKYVNL